MTEILSEADNREVLLGVKRAAPPSPEKVGDDADRLLRYAASRDYSIWAQEAWSEVLDCLDKLVKDDLTDRQVDFYRGSLAQTLKLLRVSYKALTVKEIQRQEKKLANGRVF